MRESYISKSPTPDLHGFSRFHFAFAKSWSSLHNTGQSLDIKDISRFRVSRLNCNAFYRALSKTTHSYKEVSCLRISDRTLSCSYHSGKKDRHISFLSSSFDSSSYFQYGWSTPRKSHWFNEFSIPLRNYFIQ